MPQPKGKPRKTDTGRNGEPTSSGEAQTGITWNDIKHFVPKDFTCTCEGFCDHPGVISLQVVAKLDKLSDLIGRPITILSGTRCERHNARIRGKRLSSHVPASGVSYAADVYCPDAGFRFAFMEAALLEFKRIGIGKNHIHVDDHPDFPGRVVWLSAS
jgi:zinc D-Ala-D-Ala carboxypeptidase